MEEKGWRRCKVNIENGDCGLCEDFPRIKPLMLDGIRFFEENPEMEGLVNTEMAAKLQRIPDEEVKKIVIRRMLQMKANRIKAALCNGHVTDEEESRPNPFERRTSKDLWPGRKGRKINHFRR